MPSKKKCTFCKFPKLLSDFNKKKRSKDGHQNICRECSRLHSDAHYEQFTELHKKKVREQKLLVQQRNSQFLWNYLSMHPCIDCGNSNPVVLEFDHVRGNKVSSVSRLSHDSWSLEKIQEEINKCEVRCANCHRIKTAKERNWYANIDTTGSIAQSAEQGPFKSEVSGSTPDGPTDF